MCSITGEKKWMTQENGNDEPRVEVRGDAAGTGQEQTLHASWLQGHKACRQFHVLICEKINKRDRSRFKTMSGCLRKEVTIWVSNLSEDM